MHFLWNLTVSNEVGSLRVTCNTGLLDMCYGSILIVSIADIVVNN